MRQAWTLLTLGTLFIGALPAGADNRTDTEAVRRQATSWIKAAAKPGPNSPLATNVSQRISDTLDEGRNVGVLLSAELAKSGKAQWGLSWAGVFFVFDLTPEQARRYGLEPEVVVTQQGARRNDQRLAQPAAQLDRLHIDNVAAQPGDRDLTGSVTLQLYGASRSDLLLRVSYKLKGSTVEVTKPLRELPADGRVLFTIDPINRPDRKEVYDGPLPVFVDVCVEKGEGINRQLLVVSNTLGVLVDIQGKPVAKVVPGAPDVTGTKWQFPGTNSTVEFLAGGRVRFNDTQAPGKWRQEGKSVVFDCNNFTLFELELVGNDEMTGTWRRLQGDDVGTKNPSGLKRIRN